MRLLLCLLAAFMAYSGLFYVEEVLSQRDYSAIPSVEVRVAYCMVTSVSSYEKYTFAQSIARPNDSDLFAVVLSATLTGEVTTQKQGAIRSLRERDELRRRAMQFVFRTADKCNYDQITWRAGVSPWKIMERWLQYDAGFSFFLANAKQSGPDAAEQLYRLARKVG